MDESDEATGTWPVVTLPPLTVDDVSAGSADAGSKFFDLDSVTGQEIYACVIVLSVYSGQANLW